MGSEMCIRDRAYTYTSAKEILFTDLTIESGSQVLLLGESGSGKTCLLYTSDAADERSSVDLGGRRIIKKTQTLRREMRRRH